MSPWLAMNLENSANEEKDKKDPKSNNKEGNLDCRASTQVELKVLQELQQEEQIALDKFKLPFSHRVFLFLQGPQSNFYLKLSKELVKAGAKVIKINLCGGDVLLWKRHVRSKKITTLNYHGKACDFPLYISSVFKEYRVTDLVLYSDWRPLHQDAILIAKSLKILVWVFEEGYLRRGFVTLERNGVNGRSPIPHQKKIIEQRARGLPPYSEPEIAIDSIRNKVLFAIKHHFGNVMLFPWFVFYRTHRAHNIFFELFGILPRYLKRKKRQENSQKILREFFKDSREYFFYPLQLNHDSQVQLYSPYIRQEEAITTVISSFAKYADPNTKLLIKNHPLDNGLIPYKEFIHSMASALNVSSRVVFVEDGNTNKLVKDSKGVVLINSTVGMSALLDGKKVYCLGYSIYAMEGLAQSFVTDSLNKFWISDKDPDPEFLDTFCRYLQANALVAGDFYTKAGVELAVSGSIKRFQGKL